MNLEIITVNYQTADLIDNLLRTRDQFGYSSIPVKVIDNSEEVVHQSELNNIVNNYSNVEIDHVGYNLHHGLGLDRGIKASTAKYILTMDSDMSFNGEQGIEEMLKLFTDEKDYVASVCHVDRNGIAISGNYDPLHPYKYPHPALCMLRREDYLNSKFKFIHHGAPSLQIAMGYFGKEHKIAAFDYSKYFKNIGRGTVSRFGYRYDKVNIKYQNQ